jgi:hypothetical protein
MDKAGRGGATAFAKGFDGGGGTFARVVATMAAKMTLAGAAVATVTPGIVQLTAALIPAAGAAVALPAALIGIQAAAAVVKVATAGVGDAITKDFTGTAKQAKKAMDALPPSAQRFARSIIALKPRIAELRASVAQRFFAPLQDEIRPLAERYFPMLRREMANTAGPLGGLGEQVAQTARKSVVFNAVRDVFRNTRLAAVELRGGIDPLVVGFSNLIRATVPELPKMASGFTGVATSVGKWLTQASKSGQIMQIYRNAIDTIKELGAIFGDLGAIVGVVYTQSNISGGNLLRTIKGLTAEAREFVTSASGVKTLQSGFGVLASMGEGLRTGLGGALVAIGESIRIAAPLLSQLAVIAGRLVAALAPLLPAMTMLAVQVLTALLPSIISLTGWLERNQDTVRSLAPYVLGAVVAFQAYRLAVIVASVATRTWAIAMGVAKVAQAGWTAVVWLATLPVKAHTAAMLLSRSTIGTWIGVKAIEAGAWARSTAAAVAARVATLGSTAATLGHRAATLASTAVTKASAAATATWAAVTAGATAVMKGVRIAVLAVNAAMRANPIGVVITIIMLLVGVLVILYQRNQTVRRVVDAAWKGIKTAISAVGSWFQNTLWPLFRKYLDFLMTHFRLFLRIAQSVWTTARSVISGQVALVIKVFQGLRNFVTKTLPDGFKSGVSAIQRYWKGVQEAARVPVAFVVNRVVNPFITGFNKISSVFGVKAVPTVGGFAEGGQIPGPPSSKDNRVAWLKDAAGRAVSSISVATGEFIVNARDTAKALPLLRWINDGMKGGPAAITRRLGRRPVDRAGDGSEGYAFAKGGLVGFLSDVWGAISDPAKLIKAPVEAMIRQIPGGGLVRDVLVGMGHKLISGLTGFLSGGGGFGGGTATGNVGKAQSFVRAQAGKPYGWANAGPGSYDCSGIVSAAYNVMKGKNPYSHTFSTGSLPGPWFAQGRRVGPLVAGWAHPGQRGASANVGHMAGSIGGMPFSSTGSRGVRVGPAADKVTDFAYIGAARAAGGLVELQKIAKVAQADFGNVTLAPGQNLIYNGLGRPEPLVTPKPPTGGPGGGARMHPDDIAALADAIGGVLGRALLGTVPATRAAARQAGRRPGR